MNGQAACPLCRTKANFQIDSSCRAYYWFDCDVCGTYSVNYYTYEAIKDRPKVDVAMVRVIAETIKLTSSGQSPFWVNSRNAQEKGPDGTIVRNLEHFLGLPTRHAGKMDNLLVLLARALTGKPPFDPVRLKKAHLYSIEILDSEEASKWLIKLIRRKLIISEQFWSAVQEGMPLGEVTNYDFSLTPDGWEKVEELARGVATKKVFIAMSFRYVDRPKLQVAIEDACEETGWEAFTIDKKDFLGGITDEIVASINQSAFVIADFTENKHGVYYEAGYAEGRGLPVIYTVRDEKQHIDALHFDTKHLNHLTWTSFEDLKEKLKNRINHAINR